MIPEVKTILLSSCEGKENNGKVSFLVYMYLYFNTLNIWGHVKIFWVVLDFNLITRRCYIPGEFCIYSAYKISGRESVKRNVPKWATCTYQCSRGVTVHVVLILWKIKRFYSIITWVEVSSFKQCPVSNVANRRLQIIVVTYSYNTRGQRVKLCYTQ